MFGRIDKERQKKGVSGWGLRQGEAGWICMYVYTHICIYVYMYIFTNVCMYIFICVYMYLCIYRDRNGTTADGRRHLYFTQTAFIFYSDGIYILPRQERYHGRRQN